MPQCAGASRHPIAGAFGRGPVAGRAETLVNYPGSGLEGRVAGRRVRIGNEAFCRELAGAPLPGGVRPGAVCLADETGWLAVFQLEDAARSEAAGVVRALEAAGLRVHLLSGDEPRAVEDMARKLGIECVEGGATPQRKFAYVEALQAEGRVVAMAGDGLNDAPVLARADASIAMGGGSEIAQLSSDLVLLGGRLSALPEAIAEARRALRVIRQNFAWALGYNALALPLAASGWIGPLEAAIGMAASSFIVVLNALRVDAAPAEQQAWKASSSSSPSPSPSYS